MAKRTQDEIDRQIEGLRKMKGTLPEFSKFRDNNWEMIDAKIDILLGNKEPDDFYVDESSDDYQDGDNALWSEAETANQWLKGNETEDLFE